MLGISCQPPEPPVSSLSHWNSSSIRPRLASRNIHTGSLTNGFSCSISALLHQEKWLKCFPGSCCIHECSLSQEKDLRANGHWANVHEEELRARGLFIPSFCPSILGRQYSMLLYTLQFVSAWTVLHPLLCKYRITSNRENWEKLHPDASV